MRQIRFLDMVCTTSFLFISVWFGAEAQDNPPIANSTVEQVRAIAADKAKLTVAQKKLSTDLRNAIKVDAGKPLVQGVPNLLAEEILTPDEQPKGKVAVNIKGKITPEIQSFVQKQGGIITATLPDQMSAIISLSKIESIANRREVKHIDESPTPLTNANTTLLPNTEGDIAHAATTARSRFDADGSGVKVCVLSDSVDGLGQAQKDGSLGAVEVLQGQQGRGRGEGTAILEIIHRIAPGATLAFATGSAGDISMAVNIGALADAGCTIIVDDITYSNESPFQDGVIARKINDISSRGILYFSSAANSGNKLHNQSGTWEGDFRPLSAQPITIRGKTWYAHAFTPGQYKNTVTAVGPTKVAALFWNDPLSKATNEYDLYILDSAGNVVTYSDNDITGSEDPFQKAAIDVGQSILILQRPGAKARFLHLDTFRGRIEISTSGSTRGHNASGAENAFSIASISARGRTQPFVGGLGVHVDDYSSDGPRRIFFAADGSTITPSDMTQTGGRLLQKPDLTAADCVTTDVINFGSFCGTSAAAPQAAAIAALLKSKYQALSPSQIRRILSSTSLSIEAVNGWNSAAGFGIVMAEAALAAAGNVAN
jgi:subtilisin family serine protease